MKIESVDRNMLLDHHVVSRPQGKPVQLQWKLRSIVEGCCYFNLLCAAAKLTLPWWKFWNRLNIAAPIFRWDTCTWQTCSPERAFRSIEIVHSETWNKTNVKSHYFKGCPEAYTGILSLIAEILLIV